LLFVAVDYDCNKAYCNKAYYLFIYLFMNMKIVHKCTIKTYENLKNKIKD